MFKNMSSVSVITVTKNNLNGLKKTISSLQNLKFRPLEIIIKDGESEDGTIEYVQDLERLKIFNKLTFIKGNDRGIYHAMNIAREKSSGQLLHYLNAGDEVFGEPYALLKNDPSVMSVKMVDPINNKFWLDYIKLNGYGYCHQGIIFSKNHVFYNEKYKLAADFDVILQSFPSGLKKINKVTSGGAIYDVSGISSVRSFNNKKEIISILINNKKYITLLMVFPIIIIHLIVPRVIKRGLLKFLRKWH